MSREGRRRICAVITARPSYSRIRTALLALRDHPVIDLQIVASGSLLLDRYGSAVNVVEKDGFEVASRVFMIVEGDGPATMAKSTGIGLVELSTVFGQLRPDMVISVADRFETIATAVASSYMNIPLVHVQGGEVSGSIDDKVRNAVTQLADVHFAATEQAARRIVGMGAAPSSVFVTGCPSIDMAAEVARTPKLDFDPIDRYGGVGANIDVGDGYLVVVQHPVTTEFELARAHALETLHAVHDLGLAAVWFWPNVDAGSDGTANAIRSYRELNDPENIHFFKNMEPRDFLRLLAGARCLVGNSSVGIRECSFLGVPVVNIGSRQAGRERAHNVLDVTHDRDEISAAVRKQMDHGPYPSDRLYGDGRAGKRIADLLARADLLDGGRRTRRQSLAASG